MSMKQELETWVSALAYYDKNEFEEAVRAFQPIADTSRILFNCGVIRATLGEHEAAVQYYHQAIHLDQYLAVAYFQAGVSDFLIGNFEEALAEFNDALLYLRGNNNINYEQLGLRFKLFSCEVLFNRGLCYVYLQAVDTGLQDMIDATREKVIEDHGVIDDAIKDKAEGYTVFSIPVGCLFRPSDAKVKNFRTRDYLGKPQLVRNNTDLSLSQTPNSSHRRHVSADTWAKDDRPPEKLSYAATNLVRPNLSSRTRQQSEPPIHRNVFPPTPPPEAEKPMNMRMVHPATEPVRRSDPNETVQKRSPNGAANGHVNASRSHSATRAPKPEKLDLGRAAFEQPLASRDHHTRRSAARSASERPAERRPLNYEPDHRYKSNRERERLFGQVDDNESAEDVGARLYEEHARRNPNASAGSDSRSRRRPSGRGQSHHTQPTRHQLITEEDEGDEEVIADSPGVRGSSSSAPSSNSHHQHHDPRRPPTQRTVSSRSNPIPGLRTLRIKVHFGEDTRYIIVSPNCSFREFVETVCKKFQAGVIGGKSGSVKIKMRDEEGDLITMGDEEDWNMTVEGCRVMARKEESDMGKIEVWAQEVP